MVSAVVKALGSGIYTPSEAAMYARVNTQVMNRWVFGDAKGDAVLYAQIGRKGDESVVTFLDFVQALAVRVLRYHYDVPLPRIREAIEAARKHDIEYPFAVNHETFLIGNRLAIDIGGQRYMELSGRSRENFLINEVVEVHKRRVEYGDGGLASKFIAFQEGDLKITMNPKVRFGEPIIESCGYTAQTLWEAVMSEGGSHAAAEAYGVDIREVELACSYFDYLQAP